jgi:hypothetical protein
MRNIRLQRVKSNPSHELAENLFLPTNITSMMSFLYKKIERENILNNLSNPMHPGDIHLNKDVKGFGKLFELHRNEG